MWLQCCSAEVPDELPVVINETKGPLKFMDGLGIFSFLLFSCLLL